MLLQNLDCVVQGAGTLRLVRSWRRWRGERIVPLKSAIDLRDVSRFLPWFGLLELGDTETVRARLAGTALLHVYGSDMTGKNLKEITRPEDWPRRNARCRSLASQPCGSIYRCAKPLSDGKIASYETVSLPLDVDPAGSVRHVLYCIARLPDGPAAGAARVAKATEFEFVDVGCGTPTVR